MGFYSVVVVIVVLIDGGGSDDDDDVSVWCLFTCKLCTHDKKKGKRERKQENSFVRNTNRD